MNENISTIARIINFTQVNDVEGVIRYAKKLVPEEEWETLDKIIRTSFDTNAPNATMDNNKTLAEQLQEHLNSISKEEAEAEWESISHTKFRKRWVDKMHALSKEKRIELIGKAKAKYESEKYKKSEYAKGYEPRCPLYELCVDYAIEYEKSIPSRHIYFPLDAYMIDDTYVIELTYGQGSIIKVYTLDEYKSLI